MTPASAISDPRPNILLIVADDLGYSDIGALGGEIDTPNLDALFKQGRHLSTMYVAPTCSPTRAMLMSGMDHHLAGIGNMWEVLIYGGAPEQLGAAGYEGYLNEQIAPLPELMQAAGYRTLMAGKWHLGLTDGQRPQQRGFDHSWALMDGGAAHFNQTSPWRISGGSAPPPTYREDDRLITPPDDFYSSRTYTDKLIAYLEQTRDEGRPFFAYAAYTAPHWPIQAPDAFIEKYRGRYDAGYDAIAAARLAKLKTLGLVAEDIPLPPMPEGVKPWTALSASERARAVRSMEAYAGMVDALDHEIGRLLDNLRKNRQLDNTLIIFLSDNGPEGNAHRYHDPQWMRDHFDLSLDNIGRANSFVFQGPAWGQVSALPFRYFKAHSHEGGIRSPAAVVFPKRIAPGRSGQSITAMDIMPTILDAAGIPHPGIRYRGRNILPMQGMSMLPFLEGRAHTVHSPENPIGFELAGRTALRKGDWKILWFRLDGISRWELYNLREDPGELHDLARTHSDKLDELLIDWRHYIQRNNVIFAERDTVSVFHDDNIWRED